MQGEGHHTGTAAVFCRFSRCNLWSGREEDRATAICKFCDTDFLAGTKYPLDILVDAIDQAWCGLQRDKMVVFTGGEPAIQLDQELVQSVSNRGFYVAVETNGTLPLPNVDWVCVSPKAGTKLPNRLVADEIKLVFPQQGLMPWDLDALFEVNAKYRWLSPMDGLNLSENIEACIDYILNQDSSWQLNLQTHKIVGLK